MPYRLIKKEGAARRGEFQTVHGTVQTPAFQRCHCCRDQRRAFGT